MPPGSPGSYFENADCSFRLSVDEGNQLALTFTGRFDVESRNGRCIDYVMVGFVFTEDIKVCINVSLLNG